MEKVFAPGCALILYKKHLAKSIHEMLNLNIGSMELLNTCCKHQPGFLELTQVINICPGCDKRFMNDYENSSTISLWEIIDQNNFFPLPDYGGKEMSIMDACPTRDQPRIHNAIRNLLNKMNINIIEPEKTKTHSTCCGDSFFGVLPVELVKEQMVKRTSEMPVEEVVVYCISCIKSVYIGGKKPRYIVDLLFNEETMPQVYEPEEWHKELDEYIAVH
jgi:Fe-S oxidoreductase